MCFRSSTNMVTANMVHSLYPMYILHNTCRHVHHLEAHSSVSFTNFSTYVSIDPVKIENFHHPHNFLRSLCSKAPSPRLRLPLICFLSLSVSLAFSRLLYKWNQTGYTGFFHVVYFMSEFQLYINRIIMYVMILLCLAFLFNIMLVKFIHKLPCTL